MANNKHILSTLSPAAGSSTSKQQQQKQRVIILGGSSFMGLGLLEALSMQPDDQFESIHVLNRGNNYWDNRADKIYKNFPNKIYKNFPNKIQHWKVDRDDPKQYGGLIGKLCSSTTLQTAIIDFCAYSVDDLNSVLLAGKGGDNNTPQQQLPALKQYIYISTDSVYEATSLYRILKKKKKTPSPSLEKNKKDDMFADDRSENGGTMECMADIMEMSVTQLKQMDHQTHKILDDNDSYGLRKLQVEQELFRYFANSPVKVLSLRLADVIGPHDDSCRFWKYVLWSKVANNNTHLPITLDESDRARKLSFTFSTDVVKIIMDQLLLVATQETRSHGAYNIAMVERVTLEEFLRYVFLPANPNAIQYLDSTKSATTFYPSADLGPISIRRAVEDLNFQPTSLQEAMDRTLGFFHNISRDQYIVEKIEVLSKLPRPIKYHYVSQILQDSKSSNDLLTLDALKSEKDGKRLLKKYQRHQERASARSSSDD